MKKLRINKKSLTAILMAGSILLTGCPKHDNSNVENKINDMISNNTSFTDILDSIGDITMLDENLEVLDYESNLNAYEEAKAASDLYEINESLVNLGEIILKASISEGLGINPSDILEYNVYTERKNGFDLDYDVVYCEITYRNNVNEITTGNIEINYDEQITKKFELSSEAADLYFNIRNATMHTINSVEYGDKVFKSFERYLLASPEVDNNKIAVDYDDEKVEHFQKSKKI